MGFLRFSTARLFGCTSRCHPLAKDCVGSKYANGADVSDTTEIINATRNKPVRPRFRDR